MRQVEVVEQVYFSYAQMVQAKSAGEVGGFNAGRRGCGWEVTLCDYLPSLSRRHRPGNLVLRPTRRSRASARARERDRDAVNFKLESQHAPYLLRNSCPDAKLQMGVICRMRGDGGFGRELRVFLFAPQTSASVPKHALH